MDDGGRLDLCALCLVDETNLDGITIVFERLTPEASSLVHRLMSDGSLLLLPALLAARRGGGAAGLSTVA